MPRFATIDVGTNSVLLLVAERDATGHFHPVAERAEITRLGKGVDASGVLSEEGITATVDALTKFAAEARSLGAEQIAVTATSAARDAKNGKDFIAAARSQAGVEVEIISGDEEARLSFGAVRDEWKDSASPGGLVVIDIGGGSTEIIYGGPHGEITFRHSFDVGSVRMTERFISHDPPTADETRAVSEYLKKTFAAAPPPPPHTTVVGVAGTVTTLYALEHEMRDYDPGRVHGGRLELLALEHLRARLAGLTVAERVQLAGIQPKRADVIYAGALILEHALKSLGTDVCGVSDRGLRWGLLAARFGAVT